MYSVVLLAALSAADGSVGAGFVGYPVRHCPNCGAYGAGYYPHSNAGDFWPGYSCYGGCGGYASPAYGLPMTPLIMPLPKQPAADDKLDGKKKKGTDEDDEADRPKRRKPKPDEEEQTGKTAALITIFLPAGSKLTVDGRTVTAGVKTFITPPLEKGATYSYQVTIETQRDGKPVTVTRRLRVTAGESVHADYRDLSAESVAARK
jgi:uncharacterized protein (TIGR03000 family)